MRLRWIWFALPALGLVACNEEEGSGDASAEASTSDAQEAPVESSQVPDSLFSPVNAEHAQRMAERTPEQIAERVASLETATEKLNAAFLKEVTDQLESWRTHYTEQYQNVIRPAVEEGTGALRSEYQSHLKEALKSLQEADASLTLQKALETEIQTIRSGKQPPAPPSPDDTSNPGLKTLHELRQWFVTGEQAIETSRQNSLEKLTATYREQLSAYVDYLKNLSPEEAARRARADLKELDGEWWEPDSES